ncbi:MAG: cbb3-type cytochrome oxidase assembly protein CcoS [Bdellovibrionales bacterium]|nr:cbb3-type cytochrome oxidase assembly protein CcoS [Bdellovibrionales bacterium]
MSALWIMIPITVLLGLFFLIAFIWASRSGQFDDLETPSHRILIEEVPTENNTLITSSFSHKERATL